MIPYFDLKSDVFYYKYDNTIFPFYSTLQKIYDVNTPLEYIHKVNKEIEQVVFDTDTATLYHKTYYNSPYYSEFISIYNDFLVKNILPIFNEDIIVQKEPSFRICLPNNTALGKCKTDTDDDIIGIHCDSDYNHPPEEINFMLSITGQEETNSCYIESKPNKGDFFPVKIKQGEFMSFYGNKCRHYNKKNISGKTRISIDFRVIPLSIYKEYNGKAIHSNRKFCIGEYFTVLKK